MLTHRNLVANMAQVHAWIRPVVTKVPKAVEFRTELPKTLVGKVLRRALRQEEPLHAAHNTQHGG
nr:hypothetical protein [Anaerolineae bacterium]